MCPKRAHEAARPMRRARTERGGIAGHPAPGMARMDPWVRPPGTRRGRPEERGRSTKHVDEQRLDAEGIPHMGRGRPAPPRHRRVPRGLLTDELPVVLSRQWRE